MIRDVVVHLHNEQPILADLLTEPSPSDVCLICTNLRMLNGKTPVFVEKPDSTFVIPLAHIRFIEVRSNAGAEGTVESAAPEEKPAKSVRRLESGRKPAAPPGPADESPLERLDWVSGEAASPPPQPGQPAPQASEAGRETPEGQEVDGDELIWRIREV